MLPCTELYYAFFTLSTTFLPDVRIYAILHYLCHIMQYPSRVPFYIAPY
jgi:hypothetical protein